MKAKRLLPFIGILSLPSLVLLALIDVTQIAQACGVCVVGWDSAYPPYTTCQVCTQVGTVDRFSYGLFTRGSSAGKGDPWYLLQALNGSNVDMQNTTFDHPTTTIHEVSGIAEFGFTTSISGQLTNSGIDTGYLDLSAWADGTFGCLDCSGSHRVFLHKHNGSCN